MADLPDAIREMRPERIVIDDAHLAGESRIPQIRRLRMEMDADFSIVAVTWPGQVPAVSTLLEDAVHVDVKELDRDQILSIIKEVGVEGSVELQRRLVDQAHGRAGLAVTLAWACVTGKVREVVSGDALLEDLVGWYERTLGPASRDTLGALALAGDYGATLEQVRNIVGIDPPTARRLIRGMASGGTIDEVSPAGQQRMRVYPESLRYALVHDVFFGGAGVFDVWQSVTCLDRPSSAALPLIGALRRGAMVDRVQLLDLVDWSDEQSATEYARLGPPEFRTAIERAPHRRTRIAGAAYHAGIDQKRALDILMEQAIGDRRAEHNTPEHPLRIVASFLQGIETEFPSRQCAVETALAWLDQDRDAEVGVRVLMHAVNPEMRDISTDPGRGDTMTLIEGAVPLPWIEDLGRMWGEVLDFVERHPDLPPAPLLSGLEPWVYPESSIGFGRGLSEEIVGAIRGVATGVLERLSVIYAGRPGVLRRLDAFAEHADIPVEIDVPEEFLALFPKRWRGPEKDGDHEDWDRRASEAVALLAEGLRGRSNEEIATLLVEVEAEAAAAGITYPRQTPRLARILAENMEEPEGMFAALTQRKASPDLLLPFLDRAAALRRPGWEALIERHLDEADTSGAAVRVALKHPCEDRLKRRAVEQAAAWPAIVEDLTFRDEIDQATLAFLFEAPDVAVQRHAAVTLGAWAGGNRLAALPPSMQARWREIMVASPGDDTMFPSLLRNDPELCADWLRAWFRRVSDPSHHERLWREIAEVIAGMPAELRRSLLDDVPAGVDRWFLQDAVERLVSGDLDVAATLFEKPDLEHLHDAALRTGPSEAWMERALLALDHSWEPERIVYPTRPNSLSWSGDLSDVWQGKIDDFKRLRVDAGRADAERRERIISAGVAYFERLRDEEADRERTRRVYGRNSS